MTNDDVRALADEFWEGLLAEAPTFATFVGDHRYDDRIEDLSEEAEQRQRTRLADLRKRLEAIDPGTLSDADRVTRGLLLGETHDTIEAIDLNHLELRSDQMQGVHVELLMTTGTLNVGRPDDATRIIERFRQIPVLLETAAQRFAAGAADGRTPARICIDRSLSILDGYLAGPLDDDVFANFGYQAEEPWPGEPAWREDLRRVVEAEVRPAFQRFREHLATELLPVARSDEQAGLHWLDAGEALYASLVRHHTTLPLSPAEIHQVGLDEVLERLPRDYAEVGGRLFGITDVPQIFERLRTDPGLRYQAGAEIMEDARRGLALATAAMPAWFGRLPQSPCAIEEVPAYLAADSPAAYYFPPAGDGSRPGTYFVNTHEPGQKNRYEAASVAYHEAIPGHHLQIAIANELTDVPQFQRFTISNTAYVEGWGLYSERLADEMGLYPSDLDRIGMLAADSWRACRLVVDTGLHALGWSRQRAIDFMAEHTPVAREEVEVEIDRYIGMPGQALAYKIGQREIFRLRASAEKELGDRFDIKGFHDTVLGSGAVSLPILGELVDAWVARSRA